MSGRRLLAATAMAAAIAPACIELRAYRCDDDDACVLDGVGGRCEPESVCSYPDDDCAGGYRYESQAPGMLANACVPAPDACESQPCEATALVVGDAHACIVDGDGALWCWGANLHGQLGRGSTAPAERCPGKTAALPAVARAAASQHMCTRTNTDALWCWGRNDDGQVDWHDGVEPDVRAPLLVPELGIVPAVLDVGPHLSCAANGTAVRCWGLLPPSIEAPYGFDAPATVAAIVAGAAHACARLDDGSVLCLGDDSRGQLGDGVPNPLMAPLVASVPFSSGTLALDAGVDHNCAVVDAGLGPEVRCWGANDLGQCGAPPEVAMIATPTTVPNLVPGPYRQLALGARHSCVLAQDGRVQCWGDNAAGQVGPDAPAGFGAHTVVLEDDEALRAVEIGAGDAFTCARTEDGRVICWGDNAALQLGDPSSETTRAHREIALGC
ncbi:MAG: hypothetical protein K1X88_17145 [Nannocystaceae bacterium]|nr:hypothetical protein [Nannocystaceae bacterium]